MSETETQADRLAAITEQTFMDLVQGANFIVVCPQCEVEWAMGDLPEVRCGTCTFRGDA